jgi:hypothetical protein
VVRGSDGFREDSRPLQGGQKLIHLTTDLQARLCQRIAWLEQKDQAMREPNNPDFNPSLLLRGRIQGEMGGLKWVLHEAGCEYRKPSFADMRQKR